MLAIQMLGYYGAYLVSPYDLAWHLSYSSTRIVLQMFPLLLFLTCPLQLLTLGLFIFVVNALVLAFTAWLSGQLGIKFDVDGFIAAFLGALVVSAVSFALSRFLRRNPIVRRPV